RGAGQPGAHDDDVELAAVFGRHEPHVEAGAGPPLLDGAGRRAAVQLADHPSVPSSYSVQLTIVPSCTTQSSLSSALTNPVRTAIGKVRLPIITTPAKAPAKPRRHEFQRGLLRPRLWNIDQAPWNRCRPSAMLATM